MTRFFKIQTLMTCVMALSMMSSVTLAGEAFSNAGAGYNAFNGGTANATAGYNGDGRGYARTDTRTGNVNFAQGVSWGIDELGISFSASSAVATRFLPATASNLNISIGFDGSVGSSGGFSVADGPIDRYANAGGFGRSGFGGSNAAAAAGGRSDSHGYVEAKTYAKSKQKALMRR